MPRRSPPGAVREGGRSAREDGRAALLPERLPALAGQAAAYEARRRAEVPFQELMSRPSTERWRMVEAYEAYRTWAFCERTVILFQEAAGQERGTVELARKLSDYLHRAQHDPGLRFVP